MFMQVLHDVVHLNAGRERAAPSQSGASASHSVCTIVVHRVHL